MLHVQAVAMACSLVEHLTYPMTSIGSPFKIIKFRDWNEYCRTKPRCTQRITEVERLEDEIYRVGVGQPRNSVDKSLWKVINRFREERGLWARGPRPDIHKIN